MEFAVFHPEGRGPPGVGEAGVSAGGDGMGGAYKKPQEDGLPLEALLR